MLKSFILLFSLLSVAVASDRFTDADKKQFLQEVRQELAEHKMENKGRIDLQIIKPRFNEGLEEYFQQEKFTRAEMLELKQRYEKFSQQQIPAQQLESAFLQFVEAELDAISKKPVVVAKDGQQCNEWSCEAGLKCVPEPKAGSIGGKKIAGQTCTNDNECSSGECVEETAGSKKLVCEDVYRCFRPLAIGASCNTNPVCGGGSCLPFDAGTSGIGECSAAGNSCKSNSECCSNSCQSGQCVANNVCKDCVPNGNRPQRGQACCEGLYMNLNGVCVPDVPPSVIPQVKASPVKTIFMAFVGLFISTADAGVFDNIEKDFTSFIESQPVGKSVVYGSGKLVVNPTGSITYTDKTGKAVEITEKTNIIKAALASDGLRKEMINKYGADPLIISKETHDLNKKSIENMVSAKGKNGLSSVSSSVNIDGYGTYKFTPSYSSGGDDGTTVPSKIQAPDGTVYSPAESFYESNEYAALTGKGMTAEDYTELQEAKADADKARKNNGTAENDLEDEEDFLNDGAKDDGLGIKEGVMADKDKYSNFTPTSDNSKKLNMEAKQAALSFTRKSNFETCDINFKHDFYNALKDKDVFNLEVAMLAFDFVASGEGSQDYWKSGSSDDSSIKGRMKAIAQTHEKQRAETNKKITQINHELTCTCLDVKGYDKITNEAKKIYFKDKCDEYAKYADPKALAEELQGDASGIKSKKLLADYTTKMQNFYMELTTDNTKVFSELSALSNWANQANWNEAKEKNYDLFKFNIKNPSGNVAALGAIIGALLAAGIIAVLGGFATTSLLSTWAAAGIISASAVTGAGGLWMMASLKGAWISLYPKITDYHVSPRGYSCGKKQTCMEYTRTLVQPYNDICKIHASANACIKNFVIVRDQGESAFIVDPWIPYGVEPKKILREQGVYAQDVEDGFARARNKMLSKNPNASGGGGKKGGGQYVSELYLSEVFIDGAVVGEYLPLARKDVQANYFLGNELVNAIKAAAKEYAIAQGVLEERDTENLQQFADYAYEYHFLWPKRSRPGEISYPTVGLTTYLDYVTNAVSGNLSTALAGTGNNLANLGTQQIQDLINTIDNFPTRGVGTEGTFENYLANESAKAKQQLDSLKNLSAFINSANLDSQLDKLASGFQNAQGKIGGGVVGAGSLTDAQKGYLNAISSLRKARNQQLKNLADYKKKMSDLGNADRAARVSAASNKFKNRFTSGNLNGSGAGLSNALGRNSGSGSGSGSGAGAGSAGLIGGGLGTDAYGYQADGYGAGSGGLGASSSSTNTANTGAYNYSRSGTAGTNSSDYNKLANAVDAMGKNGKDKYQSGSDLTLFQKVTNAYIRNYDKILMKKKDKDVVEDKK